MHALSFISVLLAASVAVAEHGVGVTRTAGHAKNAERFAQGLPPLPPANLKQPTSMTCTTKQTIKGLIEVTDKSSGAFYGYVTNDYFMGDSTIDSAENLRTVSITIPCNPTASDLSSINIASGGSDHPYWGAIMSYYATNNDMTTANDNYAWMGTTDLTGKIPTVTGNSLQDAQGAEQASESPIWTYNPATGGLTMTWYNTNGSPATTIPVKIGSILYATGNVEMLKSRFNRADVYPVNYRLVQTTVVFG
ncbi:hypothetical protein BDV93DRAFT_505543 [Ceratobasidium sp. AG-I]|nr:hypothetical protein BDV93DRAFT_505543 [Ceratobasidium sp. AG-I]